MQIMPPNNPSPSKQKRILSNALLIVFSVFFALVVCEIALRIMPIPGINLNVIVYDDLVGTGYYPGATVNYRNDRGDVAKRTINQWGYFDKEYKQFITDMLWDKYSTQIRRAARDGFTDYLRRGGAAAP